MPLYVGDYLGKTQRLSVSEHGAYMLLIMEYWQSRGLPDDDRQLARIVRVSDREWKKLRPVLAPFFEPGWRHARIDAELAKADTKHARRVEAGRRGGAAKAAALASDHPGAGDPPGNAPSNAGDNGAGIALASSSHPQSHHDAAHHEGARGFHDDRLEDQLRQAAGLVDATANGLEDLSPIFALLDKGYDLDKDILPRLRAGRGRNPSSWRYFVRGIEEARAANAAIKPKPESRIVEAVAWVTTDDQRWPALAERYRRENGRPPPTRGGNGGLGYHFRKTWLDVDASSSSESRSTA